ncbi:heterokaryon incompatibility, partial [Halenospora varia]
KKIILDGKVVQIGANLEKALRAARDIPEVHNGMRIWADALCINQTDPEEKAFEVKRMGEIYQKAERVI